MLMIARRRVMMALTATTRVDDMVCRAEYHREDQCGFLLRSTRE